MSYIPSSTRADTGIRFRNRTLHNKQKRSPNLQFVPPDRRLFNMLEVIREVSREKYAEPRPVLGHMLNTGSADLFMESYKLEKKKGQDKQDFE